GPNLGRVPDPQLVAQFGHQALEPVRVARSLDPDQRRLRQRGVERSGFSVLMFQPARHHLAGAGVYQGDNLLARMQITSENRHVRRLSRQAWSGQQHTKFTGPKEPTPLWNQALAVGGPQEGLPTFLVVPRLVDGTRFHGREDAHQAGVMPSLLEDFFHPVLFAEILFADEHDLRAVLGGESFGILSQGVAQRLSKVGVIKNPDLPSFQVRRHALTVTEHRQPYLDRDAVVAGKHALNFIGIA